MRSQEYKAICGCHHRSPPVSKLSISSYCPNLPSKPIIQTKSVSPLISVLKTTNLHLTNLDFQYHPIKTGILLPFKSGGTPHLSSLFQSCNKSQHNILNISETQMIVLFSFSERLSFSPIGAETTGRISLKYIFNKGSSFWAETMEFKEDLGCARISVTLSK